MSDNDSSPKTVAVSVRPYDPQAERETKRQAYRRRDVLERLRSRAKSHAFAPTVATRPYDGADDDFRDAADEIEWLRASRPADSVSRGELDAMAEQLRGLQAVIAGMLTRIEQGKPEPVGNVAHSAEPVELAEPDKAEMDRAARASAVSALSKPRPQPF